MLRTTGSGDSFFMADSARSIVNPVTPGQNLNAGNVNKEGVYGGNREYDLLSNGFKVRSASGSVNGGVVMYFAFAENPFSGSTIAR